MIRRKKKPPAPIRRARTAHSRQRQHLIDACISALHIYGPSRTTVEKVVAIADMSPGIVRFYFDSKGAMMVASLQFLANEFAERLLIPVSRLQDKPVAALELMVNLYLDPDLASARKVSVWYAFWGEASSRQEYYDICGQKDDQFAALVRQLIERLIVETAQPQLDPDGVALGLIGVLEMLWQGFAFQTEVTIDREAAKHRCMAYLRSIFPGQFPLNRAAPGLTQGSPPVNANLPRWSYDSARCNALEISQLYAGSWQFAGHRAQLAAQGAYLAVDLGNERALIVRDAAGDLHAFRNSCPALPHRLVDDGIGSFQGGIECRVHGLRFALDGGRTANGVALHFLDLHLAGDLLFVRTARAAPALPLDPWIGALDPGRLWPLAPPAPMDVAADWKIVVENWLDCAMPESPDDAPAPLWTAVELHADDAAQRLDWAATLARPAQRWTAQRYRTLAGAAADSAWRRVFLPPNHLLELRPDGATILQVTPLGPGRSRLRRFAFTSNPSDPGAPALSYLALRLLPCCGPRSAGLVESIQRGIVAFGYEPAAGLTRTRAVHSFRQWIAARVPILKDQLAPRNAE